MKQNQLRVVLLDKGFTWLDTGNADSLLTAATEIQRVQQKTGQCIACIEQIAMDAGKISPEQCAQSGMKMEKHHMGSLFSRRLGRREMESVEVYMEFHVNEQVMWSLVMDVLYEFVEEAREIKERRVC